MIPVELLLAGELIKRILELDIEKVIYMDRTLYICQGIFGIISSRCLMKNTMRARPH